MSVRKQNRPTGILRLGSEGWVKFNKKVIRAEDPDACWDWQGCRDMAGRGMIHVEGRLQKAHRVSYELHSGEDLQASTLVVLSCSTPHCTNPKHLRLDEWKNRPRARGPRGKNIDWSHYDHRIRECVASGLTRKQTADKLGLPLDKIYRRARSLEIAWPRHLRKTASVIEFEADEIRINRMLELIDRKDRAATHWERAEIEAEIRRLRSA